MYKSFAGVHTSEKKCPTVCTVVTIKQIQLDSFKSYEQILSGPPVRGN